eukprot:32197_1
MLRTSVFPKQLFRKDDPQLMSHKMSIYGVDLYIQCPGCPLNSTKPTHWKHDSCKTRTTITADAQIGCHNCGDGCSFRKFIDQKWRCDLHITEYKKTNSAKYRGGGYARMISTLGKMLRNKDLTDEEYDLTLDALDKISYQLDNL